MAQRKHDERSEYLIAKNVRAERRHIFGKRFFWFVFLSPQKNEQKLEKTIKSQSVINRKSPQSPPHPLLCSKHFLSLHSDRVKSIPSPYHRPTKSQ